jgi:hypothetical protein
MASSDGSELTRSMSSGSKSPRKESAATSTAPEKDGKSFRQRVASAFSGRKRADSHEKSLIVTSSGDLSVDISVSSTTTSGTPTASSTSSTSSLLVVSASDGGGGGGGEGASAARRPSVDVAAVDAELQRLTASVPESDEPAPPASRTEEWDIPYDELVLERELGRGAFGVVYKGVWRLQDVAVKQLLGSAEKRGKRYRELLAECRLMMALRPHRNVVQLLGVSANVGKPLCIVMAIADRGSLRDLLDDKRQTLVWPVVLRMLIGIGAGVHHLHLEKILHRDLAARNVLLTAALEPQITDFGLSAKVLDTDDFKQSEFFRGPYKHMAPESLKDNEFSKKSDAWMFGVVAWELLSRREPHPDVDIYEAAKLIRKGATPNPLVLTQLLIGCWHVNPQERSDIESCVLSLKGVKLSETDAWHPWPLPLKVMPAAAAEPAN